MNRFDRPCHCGHQLESHNLSAGGPWTKAFCLEPDCTCPNFHWVRSPGKPARQRWEEAGESLSEDELLYLVTNEIDPGFNDYSSKCVLEAYRAGRRQGWREMENKANRLLLGDD